MDREIQVVAVLPGAYLKSENQTFPILYALHGRGAPYDTWAQMTTVFKALNEMPMILVSFHADKASWYLDSPVDPKSQFTTFFFDELVPVVEAHYRVDPARRCITGFSMGGLGAMHYMLTKPDFFTSVSGLSAAVEDMVEPETEGGHNWAFWKGAAPGVVAFHWTYVKPE